MNIILKLNITVLFLYFSSLHLNAQFVVTNTLDTGLGSLRAAIDSCNTKAGMNSISFQISGSAPHVIKLSSNLPVVSDPSGTAIDATTQPGLALNEYVTIDTIFNTTASRGLEITGSNSSVYGLHILNFNTGLSISNCQNITIGAIGKRNIISNTSNVASSYGLDANNVANLSIINNYLGVDKLGTDSKGKFGLHTNGGNNLTIDENVISYFIVDSPPISNQLNFTNNKLGVNALGNSVLNNIPTNYICFSFFRYTNALISNNIFANINTPLDIGGLKNAIVEGNKFNSTANGSPILANAKFGLQFYTIMPLSNVIVKNNEFNQLDTAIYDAIIQTPSLDVKIFPNNRFICNKTPILVQNSVIPPLVLTAASAANSSIITGTTSSPTDTVWVYTSLACANKPAQADEFLGRAIVSNTPNNSGTYNWQLTVSKALASGILITANAVNNGKSTSGYAVGKAVCNPLNISLTPTHITSCGGSGSIITSVSNGIAPYSYLWNNNETTSNISNLPVGNYRVTITDVNNCVGEQNIDITNIPSKIWVTNKDNDGIGSFKKAIECAIQYPTNDTIRFSILGAGVQEIALSGFLPDITASGQIVIDGGTWLSQSTPKIKINDFVLNNLVGNIEIKNIEFDNPKILNEHSGFRFTDNLMRNCQTHVITNNANAGVIIKNNKFYDNAFGVLNNTGAVIDTIVNNSFTSQLPITNNITYISLIIF